MDINDNGKHKNKPIAHPKTATPLYAGRYRRVVMLAIALFALLPGAAYADTLCEDGWLSPSDGGSGTCSWHGGIFGGDDYDDGDGDYGSGSSSGSGNGASIILLLLIGAVLYSVSNFIYLKHLKKKSEPESRSRNTIPLPTHAGAAWVGSGLGDTRVNGVYADGSTIYAATNGGLSISTDGGATFTNRNRQGIA